MELFLYRQIVRNTEKWPLWHKLFHKDTQYSVSSIRIVEQRQNLSTCFPGSGESIPKKALFLYFGESISYERARILNECSQMIVRTKCRISIFFYYGRNFHYFLDRFGA